MIVKEEIYFPDGAVERVKQRREAALEVRMKKVNCQNCGSEIHESTDKYCITCGTALEHLHEQCTKCDFSAIPGGVSMNYCPMCATPWPRLAS